jgi:hypothetical protein
MQLEKVEAAITRAAATQGDSDGESSVKQQPIVAASCVQLGHSQLKIVVDLLLAAMDVVGTGRAAGGSKR